LLAKLYRPNLMLHLQGQVSQYLVFQHLCLGFIPGDLVGFYVGGLSELCCKCATYVCKRLMLNVMWKYCICFCQMKCTIYSCWRELAAELQGQHVSINQHAYTQDMFPGKVIYISVLRSELVIYVTRSHSF